MGSLLLFRAMAPVSGPVSPMLLRHGCCLALGKFLLSNPGLGVRLESEHMLLTALWGPDDVLHPGHNLNQPSHSYDAGWGQAPSLPWRQGVQSGVAPARAHPSGSSVLEAILALLASEHDWTPHSLLEWQLLNPRTYAAAPMIGQASLHDSSCHNFSPSFLECCSKKELIQGKYYFLMCKLRIFL